MAYKVVDGDLDLVDKTVNEVKKNFEILKTLPLSFRKEQLRSLKKTMIANEADWCETLKLDLGRDVYTNLSADAQVCIGEIDHALAHLDEWAATRKADVPLPFFPSTCYILPQARGTMCVLGSWNFPFSVTIAPLVSIIAAGNCSIIKPSENCPHTSGAIKRICDTALDRRFYRTIEGAVQTSMRLTSTPFDYIVFTGGTQTGKFVAMAAAKNQTPCVLELGGKCPVIVDNSAHLEIAAKRIASAKWMNCGQLCISADYTFVHEDVYDAFKSKVIEYAKTFYGANAKEHPYYGRIIADFHFDYLKSMLDGQGDKVIYISGELDKSAKFFPPTIVENPSDDSKIMKEEIFGPILPQIKYKTKEDILRRINNNGRPLTVYYFGDNNSEMKQYLRDSTRSGMFVTNDVAVHFLNNNLPFGGIGDSGYGTTKGEHGFNQMSLLKSCTERPNNRIMDLSLRYNYDKDPVQRRKTIKMLQPVLGLNANETISMIGGILFKLFIAYLLYFCFKHDILRFPAIEKKLGF